MRTLFVTQWFHPEPVEVPNAIAVGLKAAGHDVEILTGVPNYPTGEVIPPYRSWKSSTDSAFDLRVRRTPLYPNHDRSAVRRMLNYLSWAASAAILGFGNVRRAEVCLVYSSPATAALGPAMWTKLLRTPYVLMIQDLWPDSVTSSGMAGGDRSSAFMATWLHRFVNWTYRRAAHIVVISPGMVNILASRGVPRDKISVVYNWSANEGSSPGPSRSASRKELGIPDDRFVATYAGNLGAAQGLRHLVDAAELLNTDPDTARVQIIVAGSGVEEEELQRRAAAAGATNLRFVGRLDQTGMATLRAASDVQIASLIDDPLFAATIPGKVQAILCSGQPIVLAIPGDAARLVAQADAGWCALPENPASLAKALATAASSDPITLETKGFNARHLYEESMSRAVGSQALSDILRTAATNHSPERTL